VAKFMAAFWLSCKTAVDTFWLKIPAAHQTYWHGCLSAKLEKKTW